MPQSVNMDPINKASKELTIKEKGYFLPILIIIVVLIVLGAGAYSLYQKQTSKPSTNQEASQSVASPTPFQDKTANWKIFTNEEVTFKYPPEFTHFTCTLKGNNDDAFSVGIDLVAGVQNKTIGCGIGLKAPGIIISVIGISNTVESYLEEISTGPNGKVSPIQYENVKGYTIGYITRTDANTDINGDSTEFMYAFENGITRKIYTAHIPNNDQNMRSLLLNILSTFTFTQ